MFIKRDITSEILAGAQEFPAITLTGPRQSGKSTLLKHIFPNHTYYSLEEPQIFDIASTDPKGFINSCSNGAILDEIQRAPELFSYLQLAIDENNQPGQFVLSGSQNFLLMERISQTLAGRTCIFNLLPFSHNELCAGFDATTPDENSPASINNYLFKGGYPRIYSAGAAPRRFFPAYLQTYLERDIRSAGEISKIDTFSAFIQICAAQAGSLLNYESLARDLGISAPTAKAWIHVLRQSFIVYELPPFHHNVKKRLVKKPKLIFLDSGLLCNLLGISRPQDLLTSQHRGAIFECAVVSEILKHAYAKGQIPRLSFWRDTNGQEVDIIVELGTSVQYIIEVKASSTFSSTFFKNLTKVGETLDVPTERRIVIYGGAEKLNLSIGRVLPFEKIPQLAEIWG